MAESGVLDHQQATTTWWLAPLFRKRYADGVTLRTLLRRRLHVGVKEIRRLV